MCLAVLVREGGVLMDEFGEIVLISVLFMGRGFRFFGRFGCFQCVIESAPS